MEPITKDAQFDENLAVQSMQEEALLPDASDVDWESREKFYTQFGSTQLAKAVVFAQQDTCISTDDCC